MYEPPFDATPIHNAMWWHPMRRRDPGVEWLRALVAGVGSALDED